MRGYDIGGRLTKLRLVDSRLILEEKDRGSRFRKVDQWPGEDAQGQDANSCDVHGHLGHVCGGQAMRLRYASWATWDKIGQRPNDKWWAWRYRTATFELVVAL